MIDVAFRAEDRMRLTEQDVMRVLDERVVLIANAYDSGFSICWPEGSRVVLDLFAERWSSTHDWEASFAYVRVKFPEKATAILGPIDEDLGEPAATLLAAHVQPSHVDVVWIGPQHLVVVRDGVVVSRTQPDTLVEMGRAQGFDLEDSPHRHVLTRTIRREDILPPHASRFALKTGDRVIVASEAVDDAIDATSREILEKLPRNKFECVIVVG